MSRDIRRKYGDDGHDQYGFTIDGIHRNGTRYDEEGLDVNGYDVDGRSIDSYDAEGYNRSGFNARGVNKKGYKKSYSIYDKDKHRTSYDQIYTFIFRMFDKNGIHQNGTLYDEDGYDAKGYDKEGYDRAGFNVDGFNKKGFSKKNSRYNYKGYDVNGYDRRGFTKEGMHRNGTRYNDDGYDINGYDEQGYDREGYTIHGINRDGINRETGEKDPRVTIVEHYVESGMTKVAFCKEYNIDLSLFNSILEIVTLAYSKITKEQIDKMSQDNSRRYLCAIRNIAKGLVDGTLRVDEFVKLGVTFEEVIRITKDLSDKKAITMKVFEYMSSGEMNMMDYFNILTGTENGLDYRAAMQQYDELLNLARNIPEYRGFVRKLLDEKRRLGCYARPFIASEGRGIGFRNDEGNDQILYITREHVEYAKQYLKARGEYICQKTMDDIFMSFAKGELTFDQIREMLVDSQTIKIEEIHVANNTISDEKAQMDDGEKTDPRQELLQAIQQVFEAQKELAKLRSKRRSLEANMKFRSP